MKLIRTLIAAINTYLDRYEQSMKEWHEADPEGYYMYMVEER